MVAPSHLKSLQALELAARTGSLKAAADVLALTPAAVGQRVKALEDYLGLELFTRGRLGLRPSPALAGALPHLSAAFRELQTAADLLDLQRGHELHVAATPDFAELWLKPRLPRFKAELPNVRFCINGEGEAPLRLGAADCEISFGPPRPDAELLFRDLALPVSSPENTARLARLAERERLEGFPLLHLDVYKDDPAAPTWPKWVAANGLSRSAPERGIRYSRATRALEAVRASAGLAICGLALVREQIEAGELSLPFPVSTAAWTSHGFHARFRSDALTRPQVRRFREWIVAEAAETAAWLERLAAPPSA